MSIKSIIAALFVLTSISAYSQEKGITLINTKNGREINIPTGKRVALFDKEGSFFPNPKKGKLMKIENGVAFVRNGLSGKVHEVKLSEVRSVGRQTPLSLTLSFLNTNNGHYIFPFWPGATYFIKYVQGEKWKMEV